MSITKTAITTARRRLAAVLDQILAGEFGGASKALARKSGLTEAQLSRVRSGERAPTAKVVGRIARAVEAKERGDQLVAAFLEVVAAEVAIHRQSPRPVPKSSLYPGSGRGSDQ